MNNESLIISGSGRALAALPAVCALIMLAAPLAGAQPTVTGAPIRLTLGSSVDIALQNNERILQSREKTRQREFDDLGALGNFLPTVTLTGGWYRLNAPIEIDLEPVRQAMITLQARNQTEFANIYNRLAGGPGLTADQRTALTSANANALNAALPPFVTTFKQRSYPAATVTAVQPLFVGGKLLAAKAYASAEERGAVIEEKRIRDEVTQQAALEYFSIVVLNDVIRTRQDVLTGMRRHRADARRLREEGLIPLQQVLRAEVAVADAERNLSDDLQRKELAMLSFRQTLGVAEEAVLEIGDSLDGRILADSIDLRFDGAEEGNPVLQLLAEKREEAKQKYRVERSAFLPQVAAFGKYELYPQYLSILEPRWTVGVQASLNIFHGLKDYAAVSSASHLESEVEHLEADARQKIHLVVQKYRSDAGNARSRYAREEANVALARENLRVTEGRFLTGLGTSLDLIDAELALEKSQIEREQALYDHLRGLVGLCGATGSPERIVALWNQKEPAHE